MCILNLLNCFDIVCQLQTQTSIFCNFVVEFKLLKTVAIYCLLEFPVKNFENQDNEDNDDDDNKYEHKLDMVGSNGNDGIRTASARVPS